MRFPFYRPGAAGGSASLPQRLADWAKDPDIWQWSPEENVFPVLVREQNWVPDGTITPADIDGDGTIEEGEGYPNYVPEVDENGDPVFITRPDFNAISLFMMNFLSADNADSARSILQIEGLEGLSEYMRDLLTSPDAFTARQKLGIVQESTQFAAMLNQPFTKAAGASAYIPFDFVNAPDVSGAINLVQDGDTYVELSEALDGTNVLEFSGSFISGTDFQDYIAVEGQKLIEGTWSPIGEAAAITGLRVGGKAFFRTPHLFAGHRYKLRFDSGAAGKPESILDSAQISIIRVA